MITAVSAAESILQRLWELYGARIEEELPKVERDNNKLIDEFFFVILGGFGISYELNMSALKKLKEKSFINSYLYIDIDIIRATANDIKQELSKSQFEPKTKNGGYRKYRFLESKPVTVAEAGYWLWSECNWDIKSKLDLLEPNMSRQWLCRCPGYGMKSASWFLRNVGYNFDYAVFDVHIIRFLNKIGIEVPLRMTDKEYLLLEEILRNICYKFGARLGVLDYLLWLLSRNGYLSFVG
ncbi:MAG: hypothetical protein NC238_15940 [Dehalobacter sp.]|nr:hypothetical protein [Dehalobacter sp.]